MIDVAEPIGAGNGGFEVNLPMLVKDACDCC